MPTKQVIVGGQISTPATGSTKYTTLMGEDYSWTTENGVYCTWPTWGNMHSLRIHLMVAPGAGKSWTFTFRTNAADTPLSVTISDADTTGQDVIHAVSMNELMWVSIESTPSNSPAVTNVRWSCVFEPLISGETVLAGNTPALEASTNIFFSPVGTSSGNGNEFYKEIVVPTPGTFKKLYVGSSGVPGAGKSFTYTYRKNSGDTALTCTISDTGSSANDVSNSFAVAAGDTVTLKFTKTVGAANARHHYGVVFLPDTEGEFIIPRSGDDLPADGEYTQVTAGDSRWHSTNLSPQQLCNAMTIKKMYVELDGAPTGNTRYRLKKNGANTALQCAITGASTTGNAAVDVVIVDGDLIITHYDDYTRWPDFATPRRSHISYLGYIPPTHSGAVCLGANF